MRKILALILVSAGTTLAQTPSYWLSGDGYNIYNGNRGNVLLGVRSPFASKLAIDPGNEAYGIALTSDQGQYGNYVQIGVLGRNMDILQGRLLFNLHTSNTDLKYAGYDFRLADKSLFYISGEGNVGIGTITKNPPMARLQIEGGPKWTTDGYNKSLFLGAQDAIGFNGGGYRFGIGATGSSLNFFSTLQESNAQTQRILSLQPNSVTVEGDLIVKGNVISNGQMGQNQQRGGYGPLLGAVGDQVNNPWREGVVSTDIYYSAGKVGIGTNAPNSYLEVVGSSGPNATLTVGAGSGLTTDKVFRILGDINPLTEIFTVVRNGNVGVGTTNPLSNFHIKGSQIASFTGTTRGMVTINGTYTSGYYTPIDFLYTDGAYATARIAAFHDGAGSRLFFGTSNNYAAGITNTSMMIDQNGNIGIGTTSIDQSSRLHIANLANSSWVTVEKGGSNFEGGIMFKSSGTTQFYAYTDNDGTNSLKFQASGLAGEGDATPRMQLPLLNKDIYMALSGGSVGVGTSNPDPNYKLSVNGKIKAHELYLITTGWSDFVFSNDYKLRSLREVEQHIKEKGHLPDIPSEKEVIANGVAVVDMQAKLLQKIEELTLYVIEQSKIADEQRKEIEALKKENQKIKKKLK